MFQPEERKRPRAAISCAPIAFVAFELDRPAMRSLDQIVATCLRVGRFGLSIPEIELAIRCRPSPVASLSMRENLSRLGGVLARRLRGPRFQCLCTGLRPHRPPPAGRD